ncbi:uncharacterized protein J3D65DRAFT_167562 [Phyllosticta citribraziliensis]|uniref:Zn(2)-C6 fungal-type domain-containing protein n=1 Tax=Phyllosticta citribraziliensis TaxID=989973 RepID=A0ABR1L4D8_9PEZI
MASEATPSVSPSRSTSPASRTTKKLRAACNLCHQMKVRCSGTKPCSRCFDSGVECVYSFAAKLGKPKGSRNKKTLERLRQMSEAASGGQTTPPCLPSPRHRSDSSVSKPVESTPEPDFSRGYSGIDTTEGDYFSLYGHLTPMSRVGGSSSSNSDSLEDFGFDFDVQNQWNFSSLPTENLMIDPCLPNPVNLDALFSPPLSVYGNPELECTIPDQSTAAFEDSTLPANFTTQPVPSKQHCECLRIQAEGLVRLKDTERQYGSIRSDTILATSLDALNTSMALLRCSRCQSDHQTLILMIMSLSLVFRWLLRFSERQQDDSLLSLRITLGEHEISSQEPLDVIRKSLVSLALQKARETFNMVRNCVARLNDLEDAAGVGGELDAMNLRLAVMQLDTIFGKLPESA